MKEEKLVPELRFSEFEGEWEEIELGEMSYDSSYGMNSSATKYDGENKYIRITDICSDTNSYLKDKVVSPEKKLEEKYLLEEGDILFARTGASVGKSYYYKKDDGKVYFAGFLIRFRIKKEFNYKFIFYNTLRNKYDNWVRVMSMRSGQPGINAQEYSRLKIKTPSKKEQNKIAEFFYKIDKKIELQKELIKNLEKQKKGFMQKIFNQEVRFKDENGEDYPEWKEKRLKDIAKVKKGDQLNREHFIKKGKYYVLNGGRNLSGYTNDWNTEKNTISISEGGESCGYVNFNSERFWSGGHLYTLGKLKDEINNSYLFQYLKENEKK